MPLKDSSYPSWCRTKLQKMSYKYGNPTDDSIGIYELSSRTAFVQYRRGGKICRGPLTTFFREWAFKPEGSEFAICFDSLEEAFEWIEKEVLK